MAARSKRERHDPQSPDKLFDAFYTTKSGGMGIGLSVSRSIAGRHHGRLGSSRMTARVPPSRFPSLAVRGATDVSHELASAKWPR